MKDEEESAKMTKMTKNHNMQQNKHEYFSRSPNVIGAKRYLQIFEDLGGLLDPFL